MDRPARLPGGCLVNERQLKLIWMILILVVLIWIGWNLMRLIQIAAP
jgi:hypothetical protein